MNRIGSIVTFNGRMVFDFRQHNNPTQDRKAFLTLWHAVTAFNRGDDGDTGLRAFVRTMLELLRGTVSLAGVTQSNHQMVTALRPMIQSWMRVVLAVGSQQGRVIFCNGRQEYCATASANYVATLRAAAVRDTDERMIQDCDNTVALLLELARLNWYPVAALFEQYESLGDTFLWRAVERSIEKISSYRELRVTKRQAATDRIAARALWAQQHLDHEQYLQIRRRFREFELTGGVVLSRKRLRDLKYLTWLRNSIGLIGWRSGTPAAFLPLDAAGQVRVARARTSRKIQVEIAEFFRVNPELAALDQVHGEFDRLFAVRRKGRLISGFSREPSRAPRPRRRSAPSDSGRTNASGVLPAGSRRGKR